MLESIEADVHTMSTALTKLFDEASQQLHAACTLSRECAECFEVRVLCDRVFVKAEQCAVSGDNWEVI